MTDLTRPHHAWTSTAFGGPRLPWRYALSGLTAWTCRRNRTIPGPRWQVRLIGAPGMVSFRAARTWYADRAELAGPAVNETDCDWLTELPTEPLGTPETDREWAESYARAVRDWQRDGAQ
jgi:hypothetical protein